MKRRDFVGALAAAGALGGAERKTILLRSSWQTVNIGDIAHTPGVLRVIDRHIPQADVILWPGSVDRGVEPMLKRNFPRLRIVKGEAEAKQAMQAAQIAMHGSAAGVGAAPQMREFHQATGRPYGFFGVTIAIQREAAGGALSPAVKSILDGAAFLFTRETTSLENIKQAGVKAAKMAFAPDGTFSFDFRDDAAGDRFIQENGLQRGKFIAIIPRLRYTPYHEWRKVDLPQAETDRRVAVNNQHKEADAQKLREAAIAWVRKTGGQVLFCPEMVHEIDMIDPLLYNPLPDDVKARAVRRKTYWLPDEAASVYRHAAAVISSECHSPIIAAVQGTPCMYVHQPEDGIKGQMWKDIGLGDWFFDVEAVQGAEIAARVLEIGARPEAAKKKVREAVEYAQKLQAEAASTVRQILVKQV